MSYCADAPNDPVEDLHPEGETVSAEEYDAWFKAKVEASIKRSDEHPEERYSLEDIRRLLWG